MSPSMVFGLDIDMNSNDITNVAVLDFLATKLESDVQDISVTTPVMFDNFVANSYRSAEYLFQLSQASSYAQVKVLVIHNGTDVAVSEYAQVSIGPEIHYSIEGDFSLGSLELTITCPTADLNPVTLKFSRVLFDV